MCTYNKLIYRITGVQIVFGCNCLHECSNGLNQLKTTNASTARSILMSIQSLLSHVQVTSSQQLQRLREYNKVLPILATLRTLAKQLHSSL